MKHWIKISLLAVICTGLSLTACKKKELEFTIRGTVTDATFQQGLSGATVKLYKQTISSSAETLIQTTNTDGSGAYSFTFKRDQSESYRVEIQKNNYFDGGGEILFSSLSTEDDNIRNYSTTAKSWVRLVFQNVAPAGPSDEIIFSPSQGKTGCAECCTSAARTLTGVVDTFFVCINDGNATYSYSYNVSGSGSGTESIVTVPFDTVELVKQY